MTHARALSPTAVLLRFEVEGQPSCSSEAETASSTAPLLSRLAAAGASCVGCTTTDDLHLGCVPQVLSSSRILWLCSVWRGCVAQHIRATSPDHINCPPLLGLLVIRQSEADAKWQGHAHPRYQMSAELPGMALWPISTRVLPDHDSRGACSVHLVLISQARSECRVWNEEGGIPNPTAEAATLHGNASGLAAVVAADLADAGVGVDSVAGVTVSLMECKVQDVVWLRCMDLARPPFSKL